MSNSHLTNLVSVNASQPGNLFSRVELGEAPEVKAAATVFQNLCYNYRDQLVAGIICAGWDRRQGAH